MYRHALLRLPCERCAVEHATRAMILSPSGNGHLCWRCQVTQQIDTHQRERLRLRPLRIIARASLLLGATASVLMLLRLLVLGIQVAIWVLYVRC